MSKIVVTGGAGFIGKATIDYALSQGHEAWRLDRADGHDLIIDLSTLNGADTVIHLAGMLGTSELFETPYEAVNVNVNGTIGILNWCRENRAAYVGITMPDSSWANVYQATKLCAMRLATAWHKNFGVPVSHVRAFNAYGPGQKHGLGHPQKVIPTFAHHAWRGDKIPVWGNGLQTVDLVHVNDVGRMLVAAAEFGNDEILDAGTGTSVTVLEVARFVNRVCGRPEDNIYFLPMRLGEEPETDIRAMGEGWSKIGWRPRFSWGLIRETVESYRP